MNNITIVLKNTIVYTEITIVRADSIEQTVKKLYLMDYKNYLIT